MAQYNKRYLYKLTFPNGMVYIGCTYDIKQRWAGSGSHYKQLPKVYEAIQEFGWENIVREVIAELPESSANTDAIRNLEKEFIKAYSGRCYNSMSNPEWHEDNHAFPKERYEPKIYWTAFGETKPAKDWCEKFKTSSAVVKKRMERYGMSIEDALSQPSVPKEMRHPTKIKEYWKSQGLL